MKTLKFILFFAWGGLLAGSFASSGFGGEAFDGAWRVNARTKTQDSRCNDRSISLVVEDGNVQYVGLLSGLVSGKVDRQGVWRVRFTPMSRHRLPLVRSAKCQIRTCAKAERA